MSPGKLIVIKTSCNEGRAVEQALGGQALSRHFNHFRQVEQGSLHPGDRAKKSDGVGSRTPSYVKQCPG